MIQIQTSEFGKLTTCCVCAYVSDKNTNVDLENAIQGMQQEMQRLRNLLTQHGIEDAPTQQCAFAEGT